MAILATDGPHRGRNQDLPSQREKTDMSAPKPEVEKDFGPGQIVPISPGLFWCDHFAMWCRPATTFGAQWLLRSDERQRLTSNLGISTKADIGD